MTLRFSQHSTAINDVIVIERQLIQDDRGWFERLFCSNDLKSLTNDKPIVQINRSRTYQRGTVRGLHYQRPPHAETKIVTCLRGEVFDVAVDLRNNSETFLHWHGERLTADNRQMLVIPEGCAHGFQALSDDVELLYLHTAEYTPTYEAGQNPQDPRIGIIWPLPIVKLSTRDSAYPLLN